MTTDKTTTAVQPSPTPGRPNVVVQLQTPIVRKGETITTLHIMRPRVGDLRGVLLAELANMKTEAVMLVLPRITVPTLIKAEIEDLDPADFTACAVEVSSFLAPAALLASLTA